MPRIILPRLWTRQPSQSLVPDWGNPIASGLELLWYGADPANRNLAKTAFATRTGTGIATAAYQQGVSRTFDGGANTLSWATANTSLNNDFTIFLVVRNHVAAGNASRMFHVGSAGSTGGVLNIEDAGAQNLRYTKLGVAAMSAGTVTCPQYAPCVITVTYTAATGAMVFLRRNLLTNAVTTQTVTNSSAHLTNAGEIGLSHSGGEGANCGLFAAAFWWRALSKRETEALVCENPWQLFAPSHRRLVVAAAAAGGTAVAQVSETDTAQPITGRQTLTAGQVAETDTAQAITGRQTLTVGQVSETDTAQAFAAARVLTLGQATEGDTAQPVAGRQVLILGQVSEAAAAQAITPPGAITVGQVQEADTAQLITGRHTQAVGQATETDTAQPITARQVQAVGQVSEADLAQPLTVARLLAAGQAIEVDTAFAMSRRLVGTVGQASEADLAQPVSIPGAYVLDAVIETDTAHTIGGGLVVYTANSRRRIGPRHQHDSTERIGRRSSSATSVRRIG